MNLKISIVIISYNQDQFLEETINSAIYQDYENKEIILIDGGSTDNSIQIINHYKNKFSHWVSEKDNGQSHAIIKGFSRCTGDIITWINSDDILCNGALRQIAYTANKYDNANAVFYGDALVIDEFSNVQEKFRYGSFNYFIAKTLGHTICQPGTFFGKEVYLQIGGIDSNLQYGMDYDLFCNFLFSNVPFYYTGQYMAKFRKYSTQKGHSAKYLKICNQEISMIYRRYGYDLQPQENKNKARRQQIIKRILNGYYICALYYRLIKRGTVKEFNPNYSE